MTFDSTHDAASHPARLAHKKKMVVVRASCANGLYTAPSANATLDSSKPMTISWDTSCFDPAPTAIDIYMTAPLNADPNIHSWTNIDYAKGTIDVDLKPKWWNSTSSISMQLNIVETGTPSFLTQFPAAPVFSVTYDASAAATNSQVAAAANTDVPDSPYTSVNNVYHGGGLSKGALAAAIMIPLLVVFGALGVYVKISRDKETKKRQRWSQAVDQRMSTISGDWKAITPGGASAAIRQSMALSAGDRGTKASSFFAGYGPSPARPSSTFSHGESGQAGLGARYGGLGLGGAMAAADGSEGAPIRRPAPASAADPTARVSRISFAADTRPGRPSMGDSLRTSVYTNGTSRASRAYHRGTVYDDEDVPPVPSRLDEMQLSPTQTDGPAPLTPQEIRAKIGAADSAAPRPSVDELMNMPAVSLIRTQEGSNEMVLPPAPPAPAVTYPSVPSPVATSPSAVPVQSNFGMATLHDAPAGAMSSPDDMLKAYAISKKKSMSNPKRGNTIETTTSANGGMRTLYAPPEESPYEEDAYGGYAGVSYYGNGSHGHTDSYAGTISEEAVVASATRRVPPGEDNNPFRKSMAVSRAFTDASRYSGYEGEGRGEAR